MSISRSLRHAVFQAAEQGTAQDEMPARNSGLRALVLTIALALIAGAFMLTTTATAASAATRTHYRTSAEYRMVTALERQINAERHAHHLRSLTMSSQLVLSARRHDVTMSQFDTMSHQLPHEAFFATRIRQAGYHYRWAGENIGWNSRMTTAGAQQLETMMYNEKPPLDDHRLNILNPHYTNVGVDVYVDTAHQRIWLTTDFGSH